MTMHARAGGVIRDVTGLHAKVGGTWRECTEGWAKVSGTWQKFYSGLPGVVLNNDGVLSLSFGSSCTVGSYFSSTGQLQERKNATYTDISGEYLDAIASGNGANFDIYAQIISQSGVSSSTGTFGSWLNLGTTRSWTITRSSAGDAFRTIRYSIRPAGGGTTLATADINYQASWV